MIISAQASARAQQGPLIGINVLLNQPASDAIRTELETHREVLDMIPEINAVTLKAHASELGAIEALPYLAGANPDRDRFKAQAAETLPVPDFAGGANVWSLDAINVTAFGGGPSGSNRNEPLPWYGASA